MTPELRTELAGQLTAAVPPANTPFSAEVGALNPAAPRLPAAADREEWRARTQEYATGEKKSLFRPSDRERAVRHCNQDLAGALAENGDAMRIDRLGKALERQMNVALDDTIPPLAAENRRAAIVLESLLAPHGRAENQFTETQKLGAILALYPSQQRDLLQADRQSGNRLYNQLHAARQNGSVSPEALASLTPAIRAAAAFERLDQRDPTGVESNLARSFLTHLERSNVSPQAIASFTDKLAFKTQLADHQKNAADLPAIAANDAHGRAKFTAKLYSAFAESPGVTDQDLVRSLNIPAGDLMKVTAMSAARGREGDQRIVEAVKESSRTNVALQPLHQILEKTGAGQWDKLGFETQALAGAGAAAIGTQLDAAAETKITDDTAAIGNTLATVRPKIDLHANHLRTTLIPDLQTNRQGLMDQITDLNQQREAQQEQLAQLWGGAHAPDALPAVRLQIQTTQQQLQQTETALQQANEGLQPLTNQIQRYETFAAELEASSQSINNILQHPDGLRPTVAHFGTNLTKPTNPFAASGIEPVSNDIRPLNHRAFMEFTRQMEVHQQALGNRQMYAAGMANVAPVLPTAGRELTQCTWLQSTVDDMARSAELIRQGPPANPNFSLRDTPLVVIDQSDERNPALWGRNQQECDRLNQEHAALGLNIVHASMADVRRLAGEDTLKMFDTTGNGNAGYGGARNMAYLIAPVIRQCEKTGQNWRNMEAPEARAIMQTHALQRTDDKLFMGDDTDRVSPGTMLAKAALTQVHRDDYILMIQQRDGRNTMGVSEAQTNSSAAEALLTNGMDSFTANVFDSNVWNSQLKKPGMGCTAGDARFCLDLPLGAEEKQHEAMMSAVDNFSTATHLSGDRKGDLSTYLQGHLNYTNSSGMVSSLVVRSGACGWNEATTSLDRATGEVRFDNVGEVLEYAADPANVTASQQAFFAAMCDWRESNAKGELLSLNWTPAEAAGKTPPGPVKDALMSAANQNQTANGALVAHFIATHPNLPADERQELERVQQVYETAGQQATYCREYMDHLLNQMVPQVPGRPAATNMSNADLKAAVREAIAAAPANGPDSIAAKVTATQQHMAAANKPCTDANRLLRDLHLVTESVGGGGFSRLAQTVTTPAQQLNVQIDDHGQGHDHDADHEQNGPGHQSIAPIAPSVSEQESLDPVDDESEEEEIAPGYQQQDNQDQAHKVAVENLAPDDLPNVKAEVKVELTEPVALEEDTIALGDEKIEAPKQAQNQEQGEKPTAWQASTKPTGTGAPKLRDVLDKMRHSGGPSKLDQGDPKAGTGITHSGNDATHNDHALTTKEMLEQMKHPSAPKQEGADKPKLTELLVTATNSGVDNSRLPSLKEVMSKLEQKGAGVGPGKVGGTGPAPGKNNQGQTDTLRDKLSSSGWKAAPKPAGGDKSKGQSTK